ncbi:hypothetical protein [Ekhidna sp.]|uniref:hypothetical protein n=1 Tax=Ekhidna sp. TaxID=2608089 RepID=UPI003BAA10AC
MKRPESNRAANFLGPEFKKISQFGSSSIEIDSIYRIALIRWVGKVDIGTTKKIIFAGINSEEFKNCAKILLDQSNLVEFSTESRIWLKHFLKNNAKGYNKKVIKLGSVKPQTASGLLFSNFASELLKSEMPDLRRKRFDNVGEAIGWLI